VAPLALNDHQLALVMAAAQPLEIEKRATFMERVAGQLRIRGAGRPTDDELDQAIKQALRGLLHAPAA
jgi:hypothetical protein